jgi:hypothetical protein
MLAAVLRDHFGGGAVPRSPPVPSNPDCTKFCCCTDCVGAEGVCQHCLGFPHLSATSYAPVNHPKCCNTFLITTSESGRRWWCNCQSTLKRAGFPCLLLVVYAYCFLLPSSSLNSNPRWRHTLLQQPPADYQRLTLNVKSAKGSKGKKQGWSQMQEGKA